LGSDEIIKGWEYFISSVNEGTQKTAGTQDTERKRREGGADSKSLCRTEEFVHAMVRGSNDSELLLEKKLMLKKSFILTNLKKFMRKHKGREINKNNIFF